MAITPITFEDYDESGAAGQLISFEVSIDDFVITDSVVANGGFLTSDDGAQIEAEVVEISTENNDIAIRIPDDIGTGDYGFTVMLLDANNPARRARCSTPENDIHIENAGAAQQPPVITNVYFTGAQYDVSLSDFMNVNIIVMGSYLTSISPIRLLNAPNVLFNCIVSTPFMMTYKPINAPVSGQTVITQVEATYTLHDAEGAPTDTGTVLAPQSLTITA